MTRALVLGGGGPVGIGWEAGLLVGLRQAGIDLSQADATIGTSAGSVVGFTLASGGDLTQATVLVAKANRVDGTEAESVPTAAAAHDLEQLMSTVAAAAADPDAAEALRAGLGRMALEAPTISEQQWLGMFGVFAGVEWPAGFACTAVDTGDGSFQVWDRGAGVDVQRAVASSCAVPFIFPPVTIGDRRWMDGGVRDMLNADAAKGHEVVLVISCTLLEVPEGFSTPVLDAVFAASRAHLDGLRAGGAKVETIVPGNEMLEISGWGLNLMDFAQSGAAYEAGVRQGEAEAVRLDGFWAG
jgi:NTE family protein